MLNGAAKAGMQKAEAFSGERERERDGGGTGGSPFHLDSTTMNGSETLGPKFREQPQSNSCPL
jgi:hypothetical protein